MKLFAYTAIDAEGRAVSGTVEAADWTSAQALLAARNLREAKQLADELPSAILRPLGAAEAVELAGYISQLAAAGLPLTGGLRSLAGDVPSDRIARSLSGLATRLEGGQSLPSALEAMSPPLPPHLREIIVSCARSGRLAPSLDRLLAHERDMDDMTRQFWEAVTYPAILLTFLVAWLLLVSLWLLPETQVDALFDMFDSSPQSFVAHRLLEFSRIVPPLVLATLGGVALVAVGVRVLGGAGRLSRLAAHVPFLGKAWWYRGLTEFSGLVGVFLEQQLPLGEALRLAALAARDPAVTATCRHAAREVAAGGQLSTCLERRSFCPATLLNLIRWGERNAALGDALRAGREMFSDRFNLQTQITRLVLPPIVFLLVAFSVMLVMSAFFLLIKLITDLASFTPSAQQAPAMSTIEFSGVASLLVVGASLLVAAGALQAITGHGDAMQRLLRFTALVALAIGLLAACLMGGGGLGFFGWLVAMGIWARVALHYRAIQKRNLLTALSVAVQRQLPLAPMARAFADEQEGAFADRAQELAVKLEQGLPLAEASAASLGALPREAELAVHIGEESGDLAGALAATGDSQLFDRTLLRPLMLRLIYVLPVMVGFLWFVQLKIAPSFQKIFDDFGVPLPPITNAVVGALGSGSSLPTDGGRWQWATAPLEMQIVSAITYLILVAGPLVVLASIALGVVAWLEWRGSLRPRVPGWKRVVNWLDMGGVLRVLALTTERQRPLTGTLDTMADFHPKPSIRRRLRYVVFDLDNGMPWQQSLQSQRLIGANDAAVLTAAERTGNLSWAMRQMADSFERRASYRLQALVQLLMPLALVPVGIVVGLIAVAYFQPLTVLIRSLS